MSVEFIIIGENEAYVILFLKYKRELKVEGESVFNLKHFRTQT